MEGEGPCTGAQYLGVPHYRYNPLPSAAITGAITGSQAPGHS
jgi:hypothetical protein